MNNGFITGTPAFKRAVDEKVAEIVKSPEFIAEVEAIKAKAFQEMIDARNQAAQEQTRQELLAHARQILINFVKARFPALLRLAHKQVNHVTNLERLQETQHKLYTTPDVTTALDILLDLEDEITMGTAQKQARQEILTREQTQQLVVSYMRQSILNYLEVYFPSLLQLAKKQISAVSKAEALLEAQYCMFKEDLSYHFAFDAPDIEKILLALNDKATSS